MKNKALIAIPLFLILAAIFACGNPSERWQKLGTKTLKFDIPKRWILTVPFTKKTIYWNYMWFQYFPPNTCQMALLKSPSGDQNQFFAIVGPKDVLWGPIQENISNYNSDTSIQSIKSYSLKTSNGIDFYLFVATKRHSGMKAGETVFLLGYAEFGEKVFLLNGGGNAPRFDFELVEGFIRSLVLE